MLKKLSITLFLMFICISLLSAEKVKWDSNYKEGNVALGIEAGYEFGNYSELAAYPFAELLIIKPDIDGLSFIDIGGKLAGRVGIGIPSPALDLGIGLMGTAHFGFKDLADRDVRDYIDPIDIFLEIGACFDIITTSGFPLGLVANSGINYWLEDDLAFGLKYSHWNSFDGATLSVHYKFKNQNKAEKAVDKALNK